MTKLPYIDIVLVKAQVDAGRLKTTLDRFGNIYLEDTIAGEAVKIGAVPEGSVFIPNTHGNTWKAEWLPDYETFVNDNGYESDERHSFETCANALCSICGFVRGVFAR